MTATYRYDMQRLRNAARANRGRATNPLQRTPPELFKQLDEEFHFTLDAAASIRNAKCAKFFTETDDGLHQPWAPETVWCNPPYGKSAGAWVEKAYREAGLGATVVMLVPSSTDLGWWHDYAMRADEIRFIRGRVKFLNEFTTEPSHNHAFTPSSILVFRPSND